MTHAEQLERRERIAAAVRDGADPMQVAQDEKVCYSTVYDACRVAGLATYHRTRKPLPPLQPLKREFDEVTIIRAFDILAELRTGARTLKGIGETHGVSHQRVSQIEAIALEKGLLTPRGAKASG